MMQNARAITRAGRSRELFSVDSRRPSTALASILPFPDVYVAKPCLFAKDQAIVGDWRAIVGLPGAKVDAEVRQRRSGRYRVPLANVHGPNDARNEIR